MAHIKIQDVWKLEKKLAKYSVRGWETLRLYIKFLCACRFYAKVIDINSSKNKMK